MNGSRFDGFSRSFATGMSRRRAIGGLGAGAVAAVGGAALGHGGAVAQESSDAVCYTQFTATVRQGPSAGLAINGILAMKASEDGAIDGATLWTEDSDDPIQVVGQALGRLIGLVFKVDEEQAIYGTGVMETDISVCGGGMGGPFSGPTEGDSGDWFSDAAEECQACLDKAAAMYNDYVNARRIIKACQAAGFCRFGGTLS